MSATGISHRQLARLAKQVKEEAAFDTANGIR
jgi:hypothetical protein